MNQEKTVGPPIITAIDTLREFVAQTTGTPPTDEEIADALKRYFVLAEIKEHILMTRSS